MAERGPREIAAADLGGPERFRSEVVEACRPVVIRGLVAHWPVVEAARSPATFRDYLAGFDAGSEIEVFVGESRIAGKYYYNDDLKGFNFERQKMSVTAALDAMLADLGQADARSIYAGSLPANMVLPGFTAQNAMPFTPPEVGPHVWVGHASNVSCHYDAVDNLACVVAGRRRFTLYAPKLTGRLYVGPIDNTMAGQPVSLAASAAPGDERFPRFREIEDQALVAELEPGDALYLPKLWWHKVEATAPLNGLVNYWWDAFVQGPDAPYTALLLAMIAVAERPPAERQAWRAFFDHYVFRGEGHPLEHLPADQRGILGPLRPDNYGRLRAHVMRLLRG